MFCGGALVVDVRVICYSRVRERTSHSGSSSYCWPRRGCMGGCTRYRDEPKLMTVLHPRKVSH